MRTLLCLALLLSFQMAARAEIVIQEQAQKLPFDHLGPFVRLGDQSILGAHEKGAVVSRDEGKTWEERTVFDKEKFLPSGERVVLRTREGVVLYVFLNLKEKVFKWKDDQGGPLEGCRIPVYVSRSADDGKTWAAPVMLQDGWCGAVRNMIQMKSGRVLLVCQKAVRDPGRHVTINYYSDDQGLTWKASNVIDLGEYGGYGDHGGGLEGTVLEMKGGNLQMWLRLPQGCFELVLSKDGEKWPTHVPSTIEASDAPGMMMRLASGRVVLLWNRYMDPVKKTGRREELSIAFSDNDTLTWSTPQVIATNYNTENTKGRDHTYRVSYPYVFEAQPGVLWITTMQGTLRMSLKETDFLQPVAKPLDGPQLRIITVGDSITKGARPGVKPNQTFSAVLQGTLRQNEIRAQVHNVGIGGERTDQVLARLERDVIAQKPDMVTVMYGTNDSWVDKGKTESRITAQAYETNLREIVARLQKVGIQVVLMTEPMFGEENPKNGANEEANLRISQYMELCRKVVKEMKTPLVDHFGHWGAVQKRKVRLQDWTTDGCHPNVAGHAEMGHRIAQVMLPLAQRMADEKQLWKKDAPYTVQLDTVTSGYDGKMCWVHPRAGTIPGEKPSVVMTMQKLLLTGSDVFYALNDTRTDDLKNWSKLTEHTTELGRRSEPEGIEVGVCDFMPKWHAKTGKLLGTGHTVRYRNNAVAHDQPRGTAYSVYDEKARTWTPWKTIVMPDEVKFYNSGAGCVQRVDLENGDILLPVYFKEKGGKFYRVTVLRCVFDGKELKMLEQGNDLALDGDGRGIYEPSLIRCAGKFYLTLRNDNAGYVSVSDDGLHYATPKKWTWAHDGTEIGNYNTQQHWVAHGDDLYLTYNRKGANNDHMIRHRAPLFMARVDRQKLQLLRETEHILVPERGARLGNFAVTDVGDGETWVTVAEWMQTFGPNVIVPVDNPYGSDNSVYAARIRWAKK